MRIPSVAENVVVREALIHALEKPRLPEHASVVASPLERAPHLNDDAVCSNEALVPEQGLF